MEVRQTDLLFAANRYSSFLSLDTAHTCIQSTCIDPVSSESRKNVVRTAATFSSSTVQDGSWNVVWTSCLIPFRVL